MLISPDFHLYRKFSRRFLNIAYCYSPQLEATSIDECFLDITGSRQFGIPVQIAEELQERIKAEFGLPCPAESGGQGGGGGTAGFVRL